MAISVVSYGQAGSYTAAQDRLLVKANSTTVGVRNLPPAITTIVTAGGGVMQGDLAVTANTSPASTVAIAIGDAWVDDGAGGAYYVSVTGTATNTSAFASCPTNSRIDLVVLQVTDTGLAAPSATFAIVTGTAAVTPVAPAVPSKALALAQVLIPNGFVSGTTNVLTANITDLRGKAQLPNLSVPTTSVVTAPVVGNIAHDGSVGTFKMFDSLALLGTSTSSNSVNTGSRTFTTQANAGFVNGQRARAVATKYLQTYSTLHASTSSVTSLAIGAVSKTFTVSAGLTYVAGMRMRATFNSTNWMEGDVSSYSGTTLVILVDTIAGSGTYASWTITPQLPFVEGVATYTSTTLTITVDSVSGAGTFADWQLYAAGWEQPVKALTSGTYDNVYRYVPTAVSPSTLSPALPQRGSMWYQTDTDRFLQYNGTAWQRIASNSVAGRTGCTVRRNAAQSIPSTVTRQGITFDVEDVDTDGFFTPSSTNIVIPAGLGGLYGVSFTIWWDTSPGTLSYSRLAIIPVSGNYGVIDGDASTGSASNYGGVPFVTGNAGFWVFSAGDIIQVFCSQQSGAAINVTARVQLYRIGI